MKTGRGAAAMSCEHRYQEAGTAYSRTGSMREILAYSIRVAYFNERHPSEYKVLNEPVGCYVNKVSPHDFGGIAQFLKMDE